MAFKSFFPLLTVGIFLLGACSAEQQPNTKERPETKEDVLAEQKPREGKTVYDANCAGCHDAGVAGAPKPGDKDVWQARLAQGLDVIVKKSIEGFEGKSGVMPPRGGNAVLSDKEVSNAVTFMIDTPQIK